MSRQNCSFPEIRFLPGAPNRDSPVAFDLAKTLLLDHGQDFQWLHAVFAEPAIGDQPEQSR